MYIIPRIKPEPVTQNHQNISMVIWNIFNKTKSSQFYKTTEEKLCSEEALSFSRPERSTDPPVHVCELVSGPFGLLWGPLYGNIKVSGGFGLSSG